MFATYGEPEDIQVYYCDGTYCLFRLIFPEKGLVVEILLHDQGGKAKITENSSVSAIVLIPTGMESYSEYLKWSSQNTRDPIVKWNGYGEYTKSGGYKPKNK
jgi:hypothetical protein